MDVLRKIQEAVVAHHIASGGGLPVTGVELEWNGALAAVVHGQVSIRYVFQGQWARVADADVAE